MVGRDHGNRLFGDVDIGKVVTNLENRVRVLSPREGEICNMIRNGLRTKDIARMHGVSLATINRHREHIRQKLAITNQEINLTTFLQSNMWEEKM